MPSPNLSKKWCELAVIRYATFFFFSPRQSNQDHLNNAEACALMQRGRSLKATKDSLICVTQEQISSCPQWQLPHFSARLHHGAPFESPNRAVTNLVQDHQEHHERGIKDNRSWITSTSKCLRCWSEQLPSGSYQSFLGRFKCFTDSLVHNYRWIRESVNRVFLL